MSPKKMYYYLFYKFYKITVTGAFPSLGKFYAEIFILSLEYQKIAISVPVDI